MYYGASLFTSISPSFCSWVLLFLNLYELKTSVEPYRSVLRLTTKFVKFSMRLEEQRDVKVQPS